MTFKTQQSMKIKNIITGLMAVALMGVPVLAGAQDFDDIYYNPSKAKKTQKIQQTKKTPTYNQNYVPTPDYQAAGNYDVTNYTTSAVRDVDEYNRRGIFAQSEDTVSVPLDSLGNFMYTQRIERFHNPEVVTNSGDQDLVDLYYSQPATTVNVYVNDPFYSPYWGYGYPYYSRWYNPYWNWGPSWSWGWYDPYWSWSWGWGPSWGWGWNYPGWGWGGPAWGPSWSPGWNHAWNTPSGSSRPHYPQGGNTGIGSGNRNPNYTNGYRPNTGRPGNMGYGRPGNSGNGQVSRPASRPTNNNGNINNTVNGNRGRNNYGTQNNNNNTRRNQNSYNNNSNSSRNSWGSGSNRGSFGNGGGSRGSWGGSGGGTRGGGGGGGRGRR